MGRELFSTLAEKVVPAHTAVLVIDVQNDFCAPQGYYGRQGADLTHVAPLPARLVPFLDRARAAAAPVIWVQAIYDPIYLSDVQEERRRRGGFALPRCVQGTWGADFCGLVPQRGEKVVTKHRYSAFVDTDLPLLLRGWGTRTLVLTGVSTDVCVECTARDAFLRDFYVVFTSDGTATYDLERHEYTLATIDRLYGVVCTLDEVVGAWPSDTQVPAAITSSAGADER